MAKELKTDAFDAVEVLVKRARDALDAEAKARSAEAFLRSSCSRIRYGVQNHYDARDDLARDVAALAQPYLDGLVNAEAEKAYVAVIEKAVADLEACRRDLPHLISKACMELGVSSRQIAALIVEGEA